MHRDLSAIVEAVAHEKSLAQADVEEALLGALAAVCRRQLGEDADVRIWFEGTQVRAARRWTVADDGARLDNPARQVRLMDADEWSATPKVGEVFEVPLPSPTLTRVEARQVYQHLVHGVRDVARRRACETWEPRIGEAVWATVKRFERGDAHLDLGPAEALLARTEQIPGEKLRVGARVRVVVTGADAQARGPAVRVNRNGPGLLEALLTLEIPEIRDGQVRVRGLARIPGGRSKVAVESRTPGLDPVAACVGSRGLRIQAVIEALGGERVDLLPWSDDPAEMAVRALAPARVVTVAIDPYRRRIDAAVGDTEVGLAHGRQGANLRAASQLVGWDIGVFTAAGLGAKLADEAAADRAVLEKALDVDAELAGALVEEGFVDLETLALVDPVELLAIPGFDEDIVAELQMRARAALEA